MISIGKICIFIFVSLFASSLTQVQLPQRRIRGGNYASPGQFPYMGILKYNSRSFCSASIIHHRWFLTAAHCVQRGQYPTVVVGTTMNEPSTPADQVYDIIQICFPSNFIVIPEEQNNGVEYVANDIAIIRSGRDIIFNSLVQKVGLSIDQGIYFGYSPAIITGWGSLNRNTDPMVQSMYYAEVMVVSPEECRKNWPYVANDQLCTDNRNGKGVCNGDSGGPLVMNGVQIGVISSTDTYCQSMKYDLYTKVASFVPWIRGIMNAYGEDLI